MQATMRLHEAGRTLMSPDDQHELIALASDLGRQLVRVSGASHND
jgi:hypothetical protein